MRRPLLLLLAGIALGVVALFSTRGADAKVEVDSGYSKTQTYNGALRYLRVDLGYEIVEKDVDAGYILFRFDPSGRHQAPKTGSLEVIETSDRVKVVIQLPQLPSYHETVLRDGLMKKLRTELGEPPKKKKDPPPPKAPGDAGADAEE